MPEHMLRCNRSASATAEMGHDLPTWKRHDHGSFTPKS